MKRGKVIDLFSRKGMMRHGQDTSENKKETESGRFVGAISADTAKDIRRRIEHLNGRREQIESMRIQWNEDYKEHLADLYDMLIYMGVEYHRFDPKTQDIMISEDGKVWLTDKS